jgi:hypothetical protein
MPKEQPAADYQNSVEAEAEANDVGYDIGYGKPPKRTRFQKGQSGNRLGRPRGSQNLARILENELNRLIPIVENGRRRMITKREAIVKQLVNKAVCGDAKAYRSLINLLRECDSMALRNFPDVITVDVFDHNGKRCEPGKV